MTPSIWDQIKKNAVALCSVTVALAGLGYNTWSHERTESNRTVRIAAFEVLKHLGELQLVVDYLHYEKNRDLGNPITGWGRVMLIKDLSVVIPEPAPHEAERLFQVWQADWEEIESDNAATERVTQQVTKTRDTVRGILRALN
jgi:hypothetical protein